MTDNELIKKLNSIVGQSIVDVSYLQTKFYYPHPDGFAQGDWTNVSPDLFVLHSPEWQIKLSGGQTLFISGHQLTDENFASKFSITEKTKTTQDDTALNIPRAFKWLDILNKPIIKFRLWQRIIKSSKFLGHEYNLQYQDHFQIIDLVCGDKIFSLTIMNGDIGDMTFYPTGYLAERVGVFFNKTICTSHTVYDLTMRVAATYKSS
ncbi:MAG: hypothetical protein ABL929_08175 [Ferruginibacter sp.]